MNEASARAARRSPWVTRALLPVSMALLQGLLVSCGGAPEVIEPDAGSEPDASRVTAKGEGSPSGAPGPQKAPRAASPDKERGEPSIPSAERASTESHADSLLYNLTEAAGARPETVEVRRAPDDLGLESMPDGTLVTELESRWSRQWSALSGGIGQEGSGSDPRREELARRLIAVGFLRAREGELPEVIEEALTYARSTLKEPQHKLMAAAFLEGTGRRKEALDLVVEVSGGIGAPVGTPSTAERFLLENLCFARTIEGPGKYSAAEPEDMAPGKLVLVYGEFRHFRSVLDSRGESPVHHRAFAASLRLLRGSGEEIDRLDFLPEGRGYQAAADTGGIVNFWARYRIPPTLEAGSYRLVVEGKDLLAGARAVSELALEIK